MTNRGDWNMNVHQQLGELVSRRLTGPVYFRAIQGKDGKVNVEQIKILGRRGCGRVDRSNHGLSGAGLQSSRYLTTSLRGVLRYCSILLRSISGSGRTEKMGGSLDIRGGARLILAVYRCRWLLIAGGSASSRL